MDRGSHGDCSAHIALDLEVLNRYNHSMMTSINTEYKVIPSEFNKKGFHYKLVKREGMKAIYHQTRAGTALDNYEVVKLGKHNGYTMGGVFIEPSETYPGSSLWGISGWTCTSLDKANERYNALNS